MRANAKYPSTVRPTPCFHLARIKPLLLDRLRSGLCFLGSYELHLSGTARCRHRHDDAGDLWLRHPVGPFDAEHGGQSKRQYQLDRVHRGIRLVHENRLLRRLFSGARIVGPGDDVLNSGLLVHLRSDSFRLHFRIRGADGYRPRRQWIRVAGCQHDLLPGSVFRERVFRLYLLDSASAWNSHLAIPIL